MLARKDPLTPPAPNRKHVRVSGLLRYRDDDQRRPPGDRLDTDRIDAQMPNRPFDSAEAFDTAFVDGLAALIPPGSGVGAYILAFNNAAFDARLRDALAQTLGERFDAHRKAFRAALRTGRDPDVPPDDCAVFLRMLAVGPDALGAVELREVGPWELQFNPVRGFRPARAAGKRPKAIAMAFDRDGFHFNRPFLRPETFWSGVFEGHSLDLLYNKFPFVERQTIVVPDRESERPQHLRRTDHLLAWSLSAALGETMPGTILAYNSLGAYASVNHLHFHLTPREAPLAITDGRWSHNGGSLPYPVDCRALDDPQTAWEAIERTQSADCVFNLVYRPGLVYLIHRRAQGDYSLPDWCGAHAWYEMAGGLVCFDAGRFSSLDQAAINDCIELASLR